jgi:hypothetical protein
MPTRSEIQDTLATSQEQVFAYFDGLSPETLERPCTASGVLGEAPWRAKDHFAHLTANEQGIQTLLRLTLTGASLPDHLTSMSPEERLAWSNQRNQTYVNAHRNDSMEMLRANHATLHCERRAEGLCRSAGLPAQSRLSCARSTLPDLRSVPCYARCTCHSNGLRPFRSHRKTVDAGTHSCRSTDGRIRYVADLGDHPLKPKWVCQGRAEVTFDILTIGAISASTFVG